MTTAGQDRLKVLVFNRGTIASVESVYTAQYAATAAASGTASHGQTNGPATPLETPYASDAVPVATMIVAAFVRVRRLGRRPSEPASQRMRTPAAATNRAGYPPRRSSALNSTMKEGGMAPRSSAAGSRIVRTAVRMAARIAPENWSVRTACGQPASPSAVPVPSSSAARMPGARTEQTSAFRNPSEKSVGRYEVIHRNSNDRTSFA